jgi:hypothetical protein
MNASGRRRYVCFKTPRGGLQNDTLSAQCRLENRKRCVFVSHVEKGKTIIERVR